MSRLLRIALLTCALAVAGCAEGPGAAPVNDVLADDAPVGSPADATCAPEVPDCVDTPIADDPTADIDPAAARAEAEALLGVGEDELPDAVRVGRRGEEHLMLTEDYVIGRITVELDDDGSGDFVVTAATVELPDGPETVTP